MTSIEAAKELDAEGDIVEAAREYEKAIREDSADLDVYLDLAVLYFVAVDPGTACAMELSQDFIDNAWSRANELLAEAEAEFGPNAETQFWARYLPFIVLGEAEFVQECRDLAKRGDSLVPYFYICSASRGREFREEVNRLYEQVRFGRTARQRYIRGVIDGLLPKE